MSRRLADTIRGYRITPLRPPPPQRSRNERDASPETRERLAQMRKLDNAWALKHGLALVMMQEQELDENGHREQSPDLPDWRVVENFAKREQEESKA